MTLQEQLSELKLELNQASSIHERIVTNLNICHTCWMLNKYRESDKYATICYDLAVKCEDIDHQVKALNQLGLNQVAYNQLDQALQYYHQALQLEEEGASEVCVSVSHNNIGQVYYQMGDLDQARKHFEAALLHCPDNVKAINNLSALLINNKKFQEAIESLHKAEQQIRGVSSQRSLAIINTNIGAAYHNLGEYDNALQAYNKALEVTNDIPDKAVIASLLYNMSSLYRAMGNNEKAEELLKRGLEESVRIDNKEGIARGYSLYSHHYEAIGDLPKCIEYMRMYLVEKEALYTTDLKNKVAELTAAFEKERRQNESMQQLERTAKMASIGVIAAGITHEINQPLNAISISAESILYWDKRNPGILPDIAREEFQEISKAVGRTREIIEHMRSFWQPDPASSLIPTSVNQAILSAVGLMESQLFSHCVEYCLHLCSESDMIMGIPVYLEHIMLNLMSNAMYVLDTLPQTASKRIDIETRVEAEKMIVQISDNGPGFRVEEINRVFEPFFSTRQDSGGTGLGLALVKHFVKHMKGLVRAENQPTGGAVITIRFNLIEENDENSAG